MASKLHENIWREFGDLIRKRPIISVIIAFVVGFSIAAASARNYESTAECILRNTASGSSNMHIRMVSEACEAEHGPLVSDRNAVNDLATELGF